MIDNIDPHYAAANRLSEWHFPIQPTTMGFGTPDGVFPTDDPILNHERWSGPHKSHLIQLPTGTISGVTAIRINKSNRLNAAIGDIAFQRLVKTNGLNPDTAFFEDSYQRMYLYECHDEVIIDGIVEIADGITMYGNGASIIVPPYPCYQMNGMVEWGGGVILTRETLRPISVSLVEYAVHKMNATESYNYYLRDAA